MSMISRQRRQRRRKALFVEALEPRIVLDGQLADVVADAPAVAAIERFESADELSDFLVERAVERGKGLFGQPTFHWATPTFSGSFGWDELSVTPRFAQANGVAHGTNVQVNGVDEGDVVKTDGEYIYVASNGELSIIDARNPAELTVVSQIELEIDPRELYVTGDRLTTISTSHQVIPRGAAPFLDVAFPFETNGPETVLTVYDIADRSSPGWISDTRIDGSLVSSRRIDDLVYLVTNQHLVFPRVEFTCDDEHAEHGAVGGAATSSSLAVDLLYYPLPPTPQTNCTYETEEAYVARISETIIQTALPSYDVTQEAQVAIGGLLNAPDEVYKPITDDAYYLSSITAVDVTASTDGIVSAATIPTNYSATVYASADNIYVTSSVWNQNGGETQLRQFGIDELGHVALTAVGTVDGTLLNQFSMDEHDGHLRVVTTSNGGMETRNRLYVLAANEQQLDVVGEIESIAPGERVFATRFMGDEAFVVTFRQIDPLFTIDLSDPKDPTIEGELEIPGFSDYLHPIGENHLVGLGQDGAGWSSDPQLSLFDVSDFTAPERIDQHVFESVGWTAARGDHHAFSYFADSQILVIPFSASYEYCIHSCAPRPAGAFWVLKVDEAAADPLQFLGTVEHNSHVLRSLAIGDTLFTISTDTVKATELESPDTLIGQLDFGPIAFRDYFRLDVSSEPETLDVLENDRGSSNTIISVETDHPHGGNVTIADDGQSIVYTPPTTGIVTLDTFTYTIDNGNRIDTASVHVTLTNDAARETMTELAAADLAEVLQIDREDVVLLHATRQTWDDCLGIESVGASCGEVLTPGFRVNFSTDGGWFQYHTDAISRVELASANLSLSFDNFEVAEGTTTLDVLANDGSHADLLRIIEVRDAKGEVAIAEDGRSLLYTPADGLVADAFSYTVELVDGVTNTAHVSVVILSDTVAEIEQASVAALADELAVDADSITIVASGVLPLHTFCEPSQLPECEYTVRVGLQHGNRFYVYHALSASQVEQDRVFEPQLEDDDQVLVQTGDTALILPLRNDHLEDPTFPELGPDPKAVTGVSDSRAGATITFEGKIIRYTPPEDFLGEDVFTYFVGDLQAEVLVHVEGYPGGDPLVRIRPEIIDANGNVVSTLHPGDEGTLRLYVEDLREDPIRVFAAFADVRFDPTNVEVLDIEYGNSFSSIRTGDTVTPGLIDELGAVDFDLEGNVDGEQHLASVTFVVSGEGTLTFSTSAADLFPDHDTLLLGSNFRVSPGRIDYGEVTVEVVRGMHNPDVPEDTNGDGEVTAIDALQVINFLNASGPAAVDEVMAERTALAAAANGEFSGSVRSFLDVNNDGHISPLDALFCINRIAERLAGLTEGEGEAAAPTNSLSTPVFAGVIGLQPDRLVSASNGSSTSEIFTQPSSEARALARPATPLRTAPAARANAEASAASLAADELFAALRIGDDSEPADWWSSD